MTDQDPPETEDPVAVLRRWEAAGATWRVLGREGDRLTVGLFSCDGGEEMSRLTSGRPDLRAYVADRGET